MLTPDILKALAQYAKDMQHNVTLVLQTGEHTKRAELKEMLSQFASISDKITLEERDDPTRFRSAVSFGLEVNNKPSGITFSGCARRA